VIEYLGDQLGVGTQLSTGVVVVLGNPNLLQCRCIRKARVFMPELRGPGSIARGIVTTCAGGQGEGSSSSGSCSGLLGFAIAVQLRLAGDDGAYDGTRRGDLVNPPRLARHRQGPRRSQLRELEATRNELLSNSTATRAALEQARAEAETLAVLSGSVAATGPGVRITIEDPDSALSSSDLLNTVQELRDAGAEVIEINDQVRVVAQTYFVDDGDVISADGIPIAPPYVVEAIGDPPTMSTAASFPGGLADVVEAVGGTVEVTQEERLR
jgi:uncharacterized protein YlxW (UPF0749 family)